MMTSEKLIYIAREAGLEPKAHAVRGINGTICVGIVCDRSLSSFRLAVRLIAEYEGSVYDLDIYVREEAHGLDRIVYFPDLSWPEHVEITPAKRPG